MGRNEGPKRITISNITDREEIFRAKAPFGTQAFYHEQFVIRKHGGPDDHPYVEGLAAKKKDQNPYVIMREWAHWQNGWQHTHGK